MITEYECKDRQIHEVEKKKYISIKAKLTKQDLYLVNFWL